VTDWTDLLSAALLGTQRREPPPGLDGRPGAGAEERLLTAAGAIALQRRAGRRAREAPAIPAPAPAETLRACPPAAAGRLAMLLDERPSLLPEWLRALAGRGLRAPAERLPELLEAATANPALREPVDAALGERGRWLAALEPRWAWAAALPAGDGEREALWLTGARERRRRLFALLRREYPERARELLARGWRDEAPEDRAWFVGALAEGLTTADEQFLERALDDRRQEVRTAAAGLLPRLPESAFSSRMRERTLPLVRLEEGGLHVRLPEGLDDAAARDGVARTPQQGVGLGARAWWLVQLVGATPLAAWEDVGLTPEQAAALPVDDDLAGPLRVGFARAAGAQRDARWAAAFAEVEPALAALLEPEGAAALALARLRAGDEGVVRAVPPPWPRAASVEALDLLIAAVGAGDLRRSRLLAERIDPALAGEAAARLAAVGGPLAGTILSLLDIRRDMHEELE